MDSISRSQRKHVKSSIIVAVQRTDLDVKQSIDSNEDLNGMVHVYVRSDGLAAAVISDNEYPKEVAENLLIKVMDNFTTIHPDTSWTSLPKGSGKMKSLSATLKKYQNPEEADPLMVLQKDVDETKEILSKTLENVYQRVEDIDVLVKKADDLSAEAEKLFKQIKIKNQRSCRIC